MHSVITLLICYRGIPRRSFFCLFCSFNLIFYIPVNNFSVTSGRVFLGWTSTKLGLMCLAQGHNVVTPVRLKPAALQSRVKHSTTGPLRSRTSFVDHLCYLCLVLFMLLHLFIAALWSPAAKGLTSCLFFMMLCFCHFPMWYPGSGEVLDCINSWSLRLSYIDCCFVVLNTVNHSEKHQNSLQRQLYLHKYTRLG